MQNAPNVVPIAPLSRGQSFSLSALADAYMACYQGRDANLPTRLRFFLERLGGKVASEIDGDDIQDCLDLLQRRGCLHNRGRDKGGNLQATGKPLADGTINRYRCAIQTVLSWGRKKRLMPKGWVNPVNETERLPEDNARVRYLTEDECSRLLNAARISQWPKLALLIRMAVTTGARRGALFGLRWRNLDLDKARAYIDRVKNGESFTLVLLPEVVEELRRIKGRSQPDDLIFCGSDPGKPHRFEKAWKNALANSGIENACFHTLRHTHASWLAQSGAPLLAIADSLGHKSLAMTKRYSHLCVDSRAEMLCRVFNQAV